MPSFIAVLRRFAIAVTLALSALTPTMSLAAAEMEAQLLAGSPWKMTTGNGRSGRLTLQADGSGTINMGPMRMALTWNAAQDGFCMTARRMAERCIPLVAQDGGFVGRGPDGSLFRLSK